MKRSDSELVTAARAGDVDSFRELYERHYRLAVGVARGRLSDHHLAEDAAQEAFATACRQLASLRDTKRFAEWLGTICRRTASRMARSETNGHLVESEPISPSTATDSAAKTRLHQALGELSASAREVIHLHYFGGLSYEEIGRALGTTPQAVHGRLQRARRTLARRLSKQDEGELTDE